MLMIVYRWTEVKTRFPWKLLNQKYYFLLYTYTRGLKVTPTVYPRLVLNYDFNFFPYYFESPNRAENISVIILSSPNKIWDTSVMGILSYDQT